VQTIDNFKGNLFRFRAAGRECIEASSSKRRYEQKQAANCRKAAGIFISRFQAGQRNAQEIHGDEIRTAPLKILNVFVQKRPRWFKRVTSQAANGAVANF